MARIDRDAWPSVAVAGLPAVVAGLARRGRGAAALAMLPVAVAAFFRDPDRGPDDAAVDDDLVLAPADGTVMYAGPAKDGVAPAGEWLQVSIFLSVLDVHINRTPYGGRVTDVTHRPGRWLAAYRAESATENERSEITVERMVGEQARTVVFRQIVGVLARRVVTRVAVGDVLATGQRIGLMKFGSRMDVLVPAEARLAVAEGARVRAGESVIATWPQAGP
jgi:phosphatidylserine decarboxylase